MRERPQPELLLADRPQPGKAVRLDDQEEDDQRAEDHGSEMRGQGGIDRNAEGRPQVVKDYRDDDDEGGAEEAAHDRAQAADDHHEQELERAVDAERRRLPRAQVDEAPEAAGDSDDEARHGEGG